MSFDGIEQSDQQHQTRKLCVYLALIILILLWLPTLSSAFGS